MSAAWGTLCLVWLQHEGHQMSGGPHAAWEYGLVGFSLLVLIWVLYLALRMTFRPGERNPDHIKRTILEDDWNLADRPSSENQDSERNERRSG
jgi:hypothetical protein